MERQARKCKLRADIDARFHARARAAAYWDPGTTLTGLFELGLTLLVLDQLEAKHGGPYCRGDRSGSGDRRP